MCNKSNNEKAIYFILLHMSVNTIGDTQIIQICLHPRMQMRNIELFFSSVVKNRTNTYTN